MPRLADRLGLSDEKPGIKRMTFMDGLCDVKGCQGLPCSGWRPLTERRGRKICEQHWRRHLFDSIWRAKFVGKLLKLRGSFIIIWLELYRSALGKVIKRAGMAFVKSNGKSQIMIDM